MWFFLLNHSIQSQYWERKCLGWKCDSRRKQGLWGVRLVSPSFLFWVACRPGDPPQVMCCVRLTQASREDLVPFKRMVFPRRSVTLRLLMQDTSKTHKLSLPIRMLLLLGREQGVSLSEESLVFQSITCAALLVARQRKPCQVRLVCYPLKVCLHHFQWDALRQRDAVNYRSCYCKFKQKC